MSMPKIPNIKIVVAGDLGTGKSCLVNFYVRSIFTEFDPEIEDVHSKRVTINDIPYNIEVVDTVDNEFYNDYDRALMYQQCDAIILTYAIDDLESFNNVIMRYSNLPINEEDGSRKLTYVNDRIKCLPPIILAATKTDLESSRQVAYQQGKKLQSQLQLQDFVECSAMAKYNVEELFNSAIRLGLTHQLSEQDLTHIYAGDEGSELKKVQTGVSFASKQGKNTIANKKGKGAEKFTPISSVNMAVNNSSKQHSNSKNDTLDRKATSASNRARTAVSMKTNVTKAKTANNSSKGSDGCCTIM